MTRTEARKAALDLLFEREFKLDEVNEEIFALSCENREIENDPYIKQVYFGVCENLESIDEAISRNAKGWKVSRLSKISRSILRLCIYEMLYVESIPSLVSINEGLELAKLYEDEKARPFINGVLNSVKNEIEKA
jgi:N utilization substance protein B